MLVMTATFWCLCLSATLLNLLQRLRFCRNGRLLQVQRREREAMRRVTHCSKGDRCCSISSSIKGQGRPFWLTSTHQFVTRNAFKIVSALEGTESRVRGGGLQQNKRREGEKETRVDADCRDLAARSGTAGSVRYEPCNSKSRAKNGSSDQCRQRRRFRLPLGSKFPPSTGFLKVARGY